MHLKLYNAHTVIGKSKHNLSSWNVHAPSPVGGAIVEEITHLYLDSSIIDIYRVNNYIKLEERVYLCVWILNM